jgi:hypothetical protein
VKGRGFALLTLSLLTLATMMAVTAPAHATSIGVGGSIALDFLAPAGNSHLTANATVTLFSLNSTTAVLNIAINNTSTVDGTHDIRLIDFGFRMSPTPTAIGTPLNVTHLSGQSPSRNTIPPTPLGASAGQNVCVWVGSNCSSGSSGLNKGQSETFRITLAGNFTGLSAIDLSLFAIKWTDCTGCSYEVAGTPRTSVPEPSTLLLRAIVESCG